MEEIGKIIKIQDKKATVELSMSSACAGCNICHEKPGSKKKRLLEINLHHPENFKENDYVTLEIKPSKTIMAYCLIFLFPILMLIAGYLTGNFLFPSQGDAENPIAIFFAIGGLVLSFVILYLLERGTSLGSRMIPAITGKLDNYCEKCDNS